MRRLTLIATVVVLAAAGLAAVAWQGPRALDWSHLEPRLRDALGREVSLDGPIRFDLLPRPQLTIGGVSAIDIEVREARAVLDAGALLAGTLKVDTLEFSGVELTFDRSLLRPLPPLPARRIRIEDSTVVFGKTVVPVETATLTVKGPEGPYRLEALAVLDGRRHRIAASVGRWRDHMPVAVSVGRDGFEAIAVGAVANDAAAGFVFSGRAGREQRVCARMERRVRTRKSGSTPTGPSSPASMRWWRTSVSPARFGRIGGDPRQSMPASPQACSCSMAGKTGCRSWPARRREQACASRSMRAL